MNSPKHILAMVFSVVAAVGLPVYQAHADATAVSLGGVKNVPIQLTPVAGPGVSCAHARLFDMVDPPPGAQGAGRCDDEVLIGPAGMQQRVIEEITTEAIGNKEKQVFPKADGGVVGGRKILYNGNNSNDKPAAARNNQNELKLEGSAKVTIANQNFNGTAESKASQTIKTPGGGGGTVEGSAMASVKHTLFAPGGSAGLAVAIVNDPTLFALVDPLESAILNVNIESLSLQADAPGDFASVLYEIGTDRAGMDLITIDISIDFLQNRRIMSVSC